MQLQHAQKHARALKWGQMHDDVHDLFQKEGKRRATSPYSPQWPVTQQLLPNQPAGATALQIAQHNSTTPSSSTDQSNCCPHEVHSRIAAMQQNPRLHTSQLLACPEQPNSAIKNLVHLQHTTPHFFSSIHNSNQDKQHGQPRQKQSAACACTLLMHKIVSG
jgi:hypothetical protein